MTRAPKGYKGLPMEGPVARQYAKLRRTDSHLAENRRQVLRLTQGLADGADVLEVAPGHAPAVRAPGRGQRLPGL